MFEAWRPCRRRKITPGFCYKGLFLIFYNLMTPYLVEPDNLQNTDGFHDQAQTEYSSYQDNA